MFFVRILAFMVGAWMIFWAPARNKSTQRRGFGVSLVSALLLVPGLILVVFSLVNHTTGLVKINGFLAAFLGVLAMRKLGFEITRTRFKIPQPIQEQPTDSEGAESKDEAVEDTTDETNTSEAQAARPNSDLASQVKEELANIGSDVNQKAKEELANISSDAKARIKNWLG